MCNIVTARHVYSISLVADVALYIWNAFVVHSDNTITNIFAYIVMFNYILHYILTGVGKTYGLMSRFYCWFNKEIEKEHDQNIREHGHNYSSISRYICSENHSNTENMKMFNYYFDMVFIWRIFWCWLPLFMYDCAIIHESSTGGRIGLLIVTLIYILSKSIYRKISSIGLSNLTTVMTLSSV